MGEVNIPFSQWFPSGDAQLWTDNLPVCLTHQTKLTIALDWEPTLDQTKA